MQELIKQYEILLSDIRAAIGQLNIAADEKLVAELTKQTTAPGFWDDPSEAAKTSQRLAELVNRSQSWRQLETQAADELATLSDPDFQNDPDFVASALTRTTYDKLASEFHAKQFELKLSGPHDRSSAILELHAGAGGTDAQDWTQMLERMYLRWAEQNGFKAEIVSQSDGEEAGIKSATIEINGDYAYGKLKGEAGVHRLVRLSPFNSDSLRQTSFALVEVLPQLASDNTVSIDPKDLRIDVYRSGGHGGQSVNTTDSAVRITHLPTGIVVAIQNERSQLQNREKAMAILTSRLLNLMEAEHKAELSELRAGDRAAEWGQQIRNYVLHPYTKVKDTRTGHETADTSSVLDGDLNGFIDAFLTGMINEKQ